MCFSIGSTPPSISPSQTARARCCDPVGIAAISAVADHQVGAGNRQIEHRHAVDGDAEPREIVGDQPSAEPRRLPGLQIGQCRNLRRGWIGAPMGRPQSRHPAAFLIDQHRRIGASDAVAQCVNQPAHLVGRAAIAAKQDEPRRIGRGEKAPLVGAQLFAGATENDRTRPASR